MNKRKLFRKVLSGSGNVRFSEMRGMLEAFGFRLAQVSGSHHIFVHPRIPELINIQNRKGKAKEYQIRQFIALMEQYNLRFEEET